jgi:hypothetical protein
MQDSGLTREFDDPFHVLLNPSRLLRAIVQFADNDGWEENLVCFADVLQHGRVPREDGDHDVRIEQESTTHPD